MTPTANTSGKPRRRPSSEVNGQGALFGADPIPAQRRPVAARATTNDLDLIEEVIRYAADPGYVLIGHAERVYRRRPGQPEHIHRVPPYEDAAVHQLLHTRALNRGEEDQVQHGSHQGRAISVRVPKSTAATIARWGTYKKLGTG